MTEVAAAPIASLQSAARSDPGRVRSNNEDLPLLDRDRGVFGVIDGVGGHAAGEIAAGIAREVILQRLARPLGTPAERVREAIAIANNEIFRRGEESLDLRGMTCVVTLAVVSEGAVTIGHVGDSRLYKLRADGMRKLTHDHSPVGEREDAREISEAVAMQHPRRNEVFRDVGGAYRDKDEDDFVEIIEAPFDDDCALLLCTDGLSDMLPSMTVEQIVRRHAGRPQDVVDALVSAANEAGGRDNVTVVYVEAPGFAQSIRRTATPPRPAGPVKRAAGWIARSRTTWFAIGALAGVLGALALIWRIGGIPGGSARTLVVGTDRPGAYAAIADAMTVARPGDSVQLEPGVYHEAAVVADGVDLIARVPGSVRFVRPSEVTGDWVGITAGGNLSARISGLRLESSREQPMDVGIRIGGQGRSLDLLDLSGPMRAGIELLPAGAVRMQGSYLAVEGVAVSMAEGSEAAMTNNVFVRTGPPGAPIALSGPARPSLVRNVFAGFGVDVVSGVTPAQRQQLLSGNFLLAAEPWLLR